MQYLAKHIRWAPFKTADADDGTGMPKLGEPVDIGALNNMSEQLNYNEASGYGDDVRKVYIKQFRDGTLSVETLYLSNEAFSAVCAATLDGGKKRLTFSVNDNPPYGSLALVTGERDNNDQPKYRGVLYPKVKANVEGLTAQTKGESISLSNAKLTFAVNALKNGEFRVFSEEFDTEAECIAWVDEQIKAAS